jgi:hypothetical protein
MEKRSRRRIRDLVARPASQGLSENEIGCARISMMARNTNVPFKGRIQKRKTYHLQIITFRLQRAAGPYRSANKRDSCSAANEEAAKRGGLVFITPRHLFTAVTGSAAVRVSNGARWGRPASRITGVGGHWAPLCWCATRIIDSGLQYLVGNRGVEDFFVSLFAVVAGCAQLIHVTAPFRSPRRTGNRRSPSLLAVCSRSPRDTVHQVSQHLY